MALRFYSNSRSRGAAPWEVVHLMDALGYPGYQERVPLLIAATSKVSAIGQVSAVLGAENPFYAAAGLGPAVGRHVEMLREAGELDVPRVLAFGFRDGENAHIGVVDVATGLIGRIYGDGEQVTFDSARAFVSAGSVASAGGSR